MSVSDEHANKGPFVLGVSICMTVLAITAVTLRFVSRRLSRADFWWDDWFILAALPWTLGANICQFYSYRNGLGQHVAVLPPGATAREEKVSYWFELIYVMGIGLNKYSILFFYRRLFPGRSLLVLLQTVGSIVLIWQIAIGSAFVWQCKPVRKAWDVTIPGTCIEVIKLWLGNAIPNIVTDFVIITIPLPLVWKLRISLSQRIALCGVFLTGCFVCAVSLIRLVAILHAKEEDITWNYTEVAIWSAVEPSIGLVCACLPSIHYLLKLLVASTRQLVNPSKPRPVVSSIGKPKRSSRGSPDHSETGSLQRLKTDYNTAVKFTSEATGTREALEEFNTSVPLDAIHVQNEIEQTRNNWGP